MFNVFQELFNLFWGGVWEVTTRGNKRTYPSTVAWQHELRDFLVARNIGFFYWTLNDNSYNTGSLFGDAHRTERLEMLAEAEKANSGADAVSGRFMSPHDWVQQRGQR